MNEKLLVEIILRCNFKPFFYNFIQLGIRIFLHDHIKRVSVYKWNVIINNIVHLALLLSRYASIDIFIRILSRIEYVDR